MARETAESSFDELTRGLASGSISRGRALRLMGAALVGGTLASLGVGGVAVADNECKPTGKKCRKNAQCCSGKCEGNICVAACPSGQVLCGGSCVSNSCPTTGQSFNTTTCKCECPSGQEVCSGSCVTSCTGGQVLNSSCQCECPSGQVLCGGSCVSSSCPTGQTLNTSTCQCEAVVCVEGTTTGCGTCVSNEPGAGNRACICQTLPGGSGQICYYGSVCCFDSCAACANYPGSVCVEPTNGTFACVYPCVSGAPCGGGL
jgi:hypothetical protein